MTAESLVLGDNYDGGESERAEAPDVEREPALRQECGRTELMESVLQARGCRQAVWTN